MKLRIEKFDMNRVRSDQVIVLIGKRNTGKSFLARDILSHHADIPCGMIVSPTERANKFFSSFIPDVFIHENLENPNTLSNFVRRQEKAVAKSNGEDSDDEFGGGGGGGGGQFDPRAFLILDDCMYDNAWVKDKSIRQIFYNGRHIKMMFLITMQYPLGITPNLRTNIDYVFILRDSNVSNQRRIYENYAGIFPTFDVFRQVYLECTENYEALVIDNTTQSNKLQDVVFYYKAVQPPPFRMCDDLYWRLSDQIKLEARRNRNRPGGAAQGEPAEELFDLNSFRRSVSINVVKE